MNTVPGGQIPDRGQPEVTQTLSLIGPLLLHKLHMWCAYVCARVCMLRLVDSAAE